MKTWIQGLALLFLWGGLFVSPAAAQTQPNRGVVTGLIVDDATDDPLPSATVSIWRAADSTLASGTITLEDGRFRLDGLRPGPYYVHVSFVGFASRDIADVTVTASDAPIDLGRIGLVEDMQMLDNVEVTAERPFVEVGIDRTVYNTRDQLVSIGGNASDVLQNIPSVEVDMDGNLSLRGSQNVAVLINGRPSPMQGEALTSFLQGLPADAIERVEVIPNPSAKYEPDGMSGILNIVLKQDRDLGLSGSVTASAATSDTYSASGNINYQEGKWNLSGGYSFRTSTRDSEGSRYRENRFRDPLTYLETANSGARTGLSHNFRTGVEYRFDPKTSLALSTMLSYRGGENTGLTAYSEMDDLKALTARYDRLSEGDGSDVDTDMRLSFRRILDPGKHELTAEVRFESEWEDDLERYTETMISGDDTILDDIAEQQLNEQDETGQEGSVQIDYMRPLGENARLEAGYKGDLQRLNSTFYSESLDPALGTFQPDTHLNNQFIFDEQIHAAYGILGGQLGKVGMQTGVRLEQALTTFDLTTTGEAYDNNYFSVFPSAFLTYEIEQGRSVKLSYSKRIDRPRTRALNPFSDYDDPLFRRVGNPYLKPEYIHAFEASYTQFAERTSLTLTPYFRRTVDVVRRYETVDPNGVSILTFENFDSSDSWGAEVIGTFQWGRWLRSFASLNGYRIVTDGSNVDTDMSNNAFGYNARLNGTITVREGLAVQLSFFYRSPIDLEGGGRIDAFSSADVAVRQQFLDNKASLSLRMSDVFDTMGFNLWREDATFYQKSSRTWDSQNVYLSFTYNFGKPPRNRDRDRDRGDRGGMDVEDMEFE